MSSHFFAEGIRKRFYGWQEADGSESGYRISRNYSYRGFHIGSFVYNSLRHVNHRMCPGCS